MNDRLDDGSRLSHWLEEEIRPHAPERLIHATRERVATTRQIGRVERVRFRVSRSVVLWAGLTIAVVIVLVAGSLLAAGPSYQVGASAASTPRPTLTSLRPYFCPYGAGTCLGPLRSGAYETRSFVPRAGYIVPDGWTNTLDTRGQFDLSYDAGGSFTYPDGTVFHDGMSIFGRPVAESALTKNPLGGVGGTAHELALWLQSHVDLTVSMLVPVKVGGASGYRVTLALPAGPRTAPDHCTSDHGLAACESLFISVDPGATYGFGLVGPETAVVYLLDAPSGDTVMVVIDDVDGVDPAGLVAAATPILNSLAFP